MKMMTDAIVPVVDVVATPIAIRPTVNKKRKHEEAPIERAVRQRVETCFEAALSEKLHCLPMELRAVVHAYMPLPTNEDLQRYVVAFLKSNDPASLVPQKQMEDLAPYGQDLPHVLKGRVVDLRGYALEFWSIDTLEEEQHQRAADIMRMVLKQLPGVTIQLYAQFTWCVQHNIIGEDALPMRSMKMASGVTTWQTVLKEAPELQSSLQLEGGEWPVKQIKVLSDYYFAQPQNPITGLMQACGKVVSMVARWLRSSGNPLNRVLSDLQTQCNTIARVCLHSVAAAAREYGMVSQAVFGSLLRSPLKRT